MIGQGYQSVVNMTEKHLISDICSDSEVYEVHKIDDMEWVKSEGNLADDLKKLKKAI